MIASPNRSRRTLGPVIWVVIHTAEGARTTQALGNYFAKPSAGASSHVGIDDRGVEQYVPYSEAAWTLRAGNSLSDNAELCGFASWSRETWLHEHRGMLDHAAAWIAQRCAARGIPLVKLSPADVAVRRPGVIGHHDYTVGTHDGSHWDPGPGFPWDYVMAVAQGGATASREDAQVLENIPVRGAGSFRRILPVGSASSIIEHAWISLAADGPSGAAMRVYYQSDHGGIEDVELSASFRDGWSERPWDEIPDGTTQIVVQYNAPDGGVIALEGAPK